MRIDKHFFNSEVIERIKAILKTEPMISRRELSRRICEWFNWRAPNGKLQDLSCRKILLKLNKKGLIKLPKARNDYAFNNPIKDYTNDLPELVKISVKLKELGKLEIIAVQNRFNKLSRIWNSLTSKFHPLGNGPLCGRQIRYLISSENYNWIGALSFSAAAWHLKSRDEWIGWSSTSF